MAKLPKRWAYKGKAHLYLSSIDLPHANCYSLNYSVKLGSYLQPNSSYLEILRRALYKVLSTVGRSAGFFSANSLFARTYRKTLQSISPSPVQSFIQRFYVN